MSVIILDPGHGMSNRETNVYDPGTVHAGVEEATIALDYANAIRSILRPKRSVVRTRVDDKDHAPLRLRASIARRYHGCVMLSLHCNSAGATVSGTEVFYRGEKNKAVAAEISKGVSAIFNIRDRGAKLESASQHGRLAVMAFQPCFLLELGFLSNQVDRSVMLDADKRARVADFLAKILSRFQ